MLILIIVVMSVQPHQNSKGTKDTDNEQYLGRNFLMTNNLNNGSRYSVNYVVNRYMKLPDFVVSFI